MELQLSRFYFLVVTDGIAVIAILLFSSNWEELISLKRAFSPPNIAKYGYSLWVVYGVWILVIALLYPLSKKYMIYKANNREKWWLSYL